MDGVLLKGSKPIPGAHEALRLLEDRRVPWILMTNGGGISESARAEKLREKLNIPVEVEQVVQSHTPMKALKGKEDMTVLVIGGDRDYSRYVAEEYGFKKVVVTADYIATNSSIWPFHNKELLEFGRSEKGIDELKIDAILLFNDPRDLGTDVQVVADILNRDPDTHVIFSNNDWLWANDYPKPRFGQGVTRFIIEKMHQEIHGKPLNMTILGKPTKVAYDYAHHVLLTRSLKLMGASVEGVNHQFGKEVEGSHMKQVFMVGDNPASDIIGGHNYGWNTALVRTGVWRDGDKLPCWPTIVGDDVFAVVSAGLKKMGLF